MLRNLILILPLFLVAENNIYIAVVDNQADSDYRHFERPASSNAFVVTSGTIKNDLDFSKMSVGEKLQFSSIGGSNPDIYLKLSDGTASGECKTGFQAPRYFEVWTGSPNPYPDEKVIVRFCLDKNEIERGFIGIRILPSGEPRLFNVLGLEFLDTDIVVDQLDSEKPYTKEK